MKRITNAATRRIIRAAVEAVHRDTGIHPAVLQQDIPAAIAAISVAARRGSISRRAAAKIAYEVIAVRYQPSGVYSRRPSPMERRPAYADAQWGGIIIGPAGYNKWGGVQ